MSLRLLELFLDYKDEINIESDLKLLSGKYNLVFEHSEDFVRIKES